MTENIANFWASELVEDMPMGVVLFDTNGRASWANRYMLEMLGVASLQAFLDAQDDGSVAWHAIYAQPQNATIVRGDGSHLYLEAEYKDYSGSRNGRAGFYSDAGVKRQLEERVERLTMNDPLTSMLNWRGIMRELDTLVSRSRRYENPLSVMHVRTGSSDDKVIQAVSRCLREQTRWTDLVGRYSDDSFMVVLPETIEADTATLTEKIGNAVAVLHDKAGLDEALDVEIAAVQWQRGEDTRLLLERLESQGNKADAA